MARRPSLILRLTALTAVVKLRRLLIDVNRNRYVISLLLQM